MKLIKSNESVEINSKFYNFLAVNKDLLITDIVKKKIDEALSVVNDDIDAIKKSLYSKDANKDDYEYAYNYLDRECNIFKFAKKDPLKPTQGSFRKPEDDIKPWVKNVKEIVTTIGTVASIAAMAYAGFGKKGNSVK